MLILTNCLSSHPDEGSLKVANSLISRLKNRFDDVSILSYERTSPQSDIHLSLNKLFLNAHLAAHLRKNKSPLLFFPFPSRPITTALRTFMLSLYSKGPLQVLIVMNGRLTFPAVLLYRLSGAKFYLLSSSTAEQFQEAVGKKHAVYLQTGVDINRFVPVDDARKKALRAAYGLDPDKKTILHAGHLKSGRNVQQLLQIDPQYQVVLVTSTLTRQEQDLDLRQELLSRPNIHLFEEYLPDIQELFQLADAYFFPVVASNNCIDVPLSCLEAAACNLPVVSTPYGEMREFLNQEGFIPLQDMTRDCINQALASALSLTDVHTRDAVKAYDWDCALDVLHHS